MFARTSLAAIPKDTANASIMPPIMRVTLEVITEVSTPACVKAVRVMITTTR